MTRVSLFAVRALGLWQHPWHSALRTGNSAVDSRSGAGGAESAIYVMASQARHVRFKTFHVDIGVVQAAWGLLTAKEARRLYLLHAAEANEVLRHIARSTWCLRM